MTSEPRADADELIEAILKKLRANKDVLGRSLEGGSIEWVWTRNSALKVRLKPRL